MTFPLLTAPKNAAEPRSRFDKGARRMYQLSRVVWFCAANQVRLDGGECERQHGHNWRVRVPVRARELDRIGQDMHFAELDLEGIVTRSVIW